ncbi:single-stranded DNA-binding protein [Luteimonas terrae]|uniref:Single-stranded DNA-binding protein n=1 Tax=Luteimonas terrae TaxID=1530191 RepID=A0ABU1XXA5_9GAMM|nr:single-stranded DNA-binding protein [Luteimonas terrae]MDR7193395.1 single-strand DNA-binding protein [Luteimonas terrae]
MSGHQKVIATGHLGAAPVTKAPEGGGFVAEMRIAVTDRWLDKQGERIEHTEWLRIKAFGSDAQNAAKYLTTGRLITVEGKLRTEKWQASDGSDRYSTWIYAERGGITWHSTGEHTETRREHRGRGAPTDSSPPGDTPTTSNLETQFNDDDLPF